MTTPPSTGGVVVFAAHTWRKFHFDVKCLRNAASKVLNESGSSDTFLRMSVTAIAFTFLSMGAFAFLMWTIVQKQEKNDPKFEEKLAADDRRAKANRQAAGMESGQTVGQVGTASKQVQEQSTQAPPKHAP